MRKTSFSLTKCVVHGRVRYCVTSPKADGPGRARRFFASKPEAKAFLELKQAEMARHGVNAFKLSDQDRASFLWCAEQLRPYSLSVRDAVELVLPQLKAREYSLGVSEAIKRLLESKRAAGLSARHLYTLENRLSRFAEHHAGRVLGSFTLRDIESWINGLPVGAQTANHYKAALHSLFGYGLKIGACVVNPVSGIDSRKVVRGAPSILTPRQFGDLLNACGGDAEMLAYVAIGGFAGLRSAELMRLRWEDVRLDRRFIEIGAHSAKTARRRLAPICAALHEWLSPIAKLEGLVVSPVNFRRRFKAVRAAAGLLGEWEGNELRHSAASYRLAETQDAARTALEMGHSPAVLLSHYRELAAPEDAVAWFQVRPNRAAHLIEFVA